MGRWAEALQVQHSSGRRAADVALVQCWGAAVYGGARGGQRAAELRRLRELAAAGSPGRAPGELELADLYEALAAEFQAAEGPLQEAFERDEAPAEREANARAVAQHFGCSNLRCARTAGLRRADAGALFPARRCDRCRVARYCSVECQAADWQRGGHAGVCRALADARAGGGAG